MTPQTSERTPWTNAANWWFALAVLGVTMIVYLPALQGLPLLDDDYCVFRNPVIRAANGLWRIWFTRELDDFWPLSYTFFWVQVHTFGASALGYHLVNILLHVATTLLIWRILRLLGSRWAYMAALLYCVHPVNVEAVAWMFQQKTTMAAALAFGSVLMFIKYQRSDQQRRWYVWSLVLFLLSLLTKTVAIAWPGVILGLCWWHEGRITKAAIRRVLPFIAIALVIGIVNLMWYAGKPPELADIPREDGLLSRIAVAGAMVFFYAGKVLWPAQLLFVYPRWSLPFTGIVDFLPVIAVIVIAVVLLRYARTWARPWLAAYGYYLFALFPVLGFFAVSYMRFSLVADHWQYLALIGVVAIVTEALGRLLERVDKYAPILLLTACVCMLGAMTYSRARLFSDPLPLWRATLAGNPSSAMVNGGIADELSLRGQDEEAFGYYLKAIALHPTAQAYARMAFIMHRAGRFAEALTYHKQEIALKPNDAQAYTTYGIDLFQTGRYAEATQALTKAIALDSTLPDPHKNLAAVLAAQRDTATALMHIHIADSLRALRSQ